MQKTLNISDLKPGHFYRAFYTDLGRRRRVLPNTVFQVHHIDCDGDAVVQSTDEPFCRYLTQRWLDRGWVVITNEYATEEEA